MMALQTQYGGLHGMVSISCVSNHTEEETSTAWRFKDEKLGLAMDDEKYTVETTAKEFVIESRLTIHNATIEDFGVYTCKMENGLGMDTMKILLINGGNAVLRNVLFVHPNITSDTLMLKIVQLMFLIFFPSQICL